MGLRTNDVLGALCSVWAAVLCACNEPPVESESLPPPPVRCVAAQARALADEIVLRGTVVASPDHSATLSAQVPGRLVRVAVREGQEVKAGALIAEVETEPARDALQQAQAALAEAVAASDAAQTEATHEGVLVERGIAAPRSFEALRAAETRAKAAVAAAKAHVHAARQDLTHTAVRAPLDGAIVHLARREGELVDGTPAQPICDVVDLSALEVSAPATPADLIRLHEGQVARVRFEALEDMEMAAHVRTLGRALGVSGMGTVWLALETGEVTPPLGVLATVTIDVSQPHEVVTVPSVAVRSSGEGSAVVVCEDSVAHVRPVEVGRRGEDWVEIARGLSAGQAVAVDEVTGLEEGMPIDERPDTP